jgi:hypothetical protein
LFLLINPKWHLHADKETWDGKKVNSLDELPIKTNQVSFFASMMALEAKKKKLPQDECLGIFLKYFNLCENIVDPQAYKDENTALSKEAEKLRNNFGSRVKNGPRSLGANNLPSQNQQPYHPPTPAGSHPPTNTRGYSHIHSQAQPYHQVPHGYLPSQYQQPYHPPTPAAAGSHPPTNTRGYSHIHSQAQPYHHVPHSMDHQHQPQPLFTQQSLPDDDLDVAAVDEVLLPIVEEQLALPTQGHQPTLNSGAGETIPTGIDLLQELQSQPTPTEPAAQSQQDPQSLVANDYLLESLQKRSRSTIQEQQSQPLPTQGNQPPLSSGATAAIPTATPATSRTAELPQEQQQQPAPIQVQRGGSPV